jgi:hypothetical protein
MKIVLRDGSTACWNMFGYISPRLGIVFYDFCLFLRDHGVTEVIITSIVRPKKDDSGVHFLGRGIDVANSFPQIIGQQAMNYINSKYPYDKNRPEIKTVIFHETNDYNDAALHYHLQSID